MVRSRCTLVRLTSTVSYKLEEGDRTWRKMRVACARPQRIIPQNGVGREARASPGVPIVLRGAGGPSAGQGRFSRGAA